MAAPTLADEDRRATLWGRTEDPLPSDLRPKPSLLIEIEVSELC